MYVQCTMYIHDGWFESLEARKRNKLFTIEMYEYVLCVAEYVQDTIERKDFEMFTSN